MNTATLKAQICVEIKNIPVPKRARQRWRAYDAAKSRYQPSLPYTEQDWLNRELVAHFRV